MNMYGNKWWWKGGQEFIRRCSIFLLGVHKLGYWDQRGLWQLHYPVESFVEIYKSTHYWCSFFLNFGFWIYFRTMISDKNLLTGCGSIDHWMCNVQYHPRVAVKRIWNGHIRICSWSRVRPIPSMIPMPGTDTRYQYPVSVSVWKKSVWTRYRYRFDMGDMGDIGIGSV